MLEIDGSFGEGGGQIIRSALALSAVTCTEIRLTNIRANRSKPGLSAQHITAVKAVAKLCNGSYSTLGIGTDKLEFRPGKQKVGKFEFDIGTAGSITLVLQACLLPALFCGNEGQTELSVRGGTDVSWSPQWNHFSGIFLRHLKTIDAQVEVKLLSRGYYPKGGGEVNIKITPNSSYRKLNLTERGNLKSISGVVHSRLLPPHVPKRIMNTVNEKLKSYSPVEWKLDTNGSSLSPGTGVVLCAEHGSSVVGASALGKKGLPAERVGTDAAERLITEINGHGSVDTYAADQLIPYLGLVEGEITVRKLTDHTKTNIWLVEQFVEKRFRVNEKENQVKIVV